MTPSPGGRTVRSFLKRPLGVLCSVLMAASVTVSSVQPVQAQGRSLSLIRDTEVEEMIRDMSAPVFEAAGLRPEDVHIYLVNDSELNAFVSGGQNIFLHTGLILETENPNQLLGVIAHETGHIASGDLARMNEGARAALATRLLTMGLGIVAAATAPDPRAGAAILLSSDQFATLQLFTYTRVQEASADQDAARFLETAGMSGRGLVEFFSNFRYQEVFDDARRFAYFRSHPLSSQRITALTERVETAEHYDVVDSPEALEEYDVMLAKLKGFLNYPRQTYQDYPMTDQSFAARYARAIAFYRAVEIDRALDEIELLLEEEPENPYLWELKGQILFETGRVEEAEGPQRKAVELKPDAPLLRLALGQTLTAIGHPEGLEEAVLHLQRGLVEEPNNALGWRVLADAYERIDQRGLAQLASAEHYFMLGQFGAARDFGMRARDGLDTGTPEYRRATDIINASENIVLNRRRGG